VRRYLLQDSKINSTLRISILMVQVDGERSYVAPTLRTAPVFGAIAAVAGLMAPEVEDEISRTSHYVLTSPPTTNDLKALPSVSKSRDQSEVQDLYRRTLSASWQRQPSELPADECIEDIFSGGNGWRTGTNDLSSDLDDASPAYETLRPNDFRRISHHRRHSSQTDSKHHHHLHHSHHHGRHQRSNSASSDRSSSTVVGNATITPTTTTSHRSLAPHHARSTSRSSLRGEDDDDAARSRSGSLTSLAPTLSSERAREHGGLKHVREVHEGEIRDDLVAWRLPGVPAS
jgi:hypothetical protein